MLVTGRVHQQDSCSRGSNGLPVRLALTPGEAHDNRLAGRLLSGLKSGSMLLSDRGYDADWIREFAMNKGAWANIPRQSNRNDPIRFCPYLYRARNLVERFFNRIKRCRRVANALRQACRQLPGLCPACIHPAMAGCRY
jgi:transposase